MLLIIITSIIFTEVNKYAANGFSEEMKSLWDTWEIRGMIILSLVLQVVLVGLGHRLQSRGSAKNAIVWLTYLSADWVATASLGFLMRSEKDKFTELAAFWAPFLLLHLGGPDSITAYSLEDNELWLRHLLSFFYQVTVTIYIFCKFQGSAVTYLAIPMFVGAIIKYGERIWSLRSASGYMLRESLYYPSTLDKLAFVREEYVSGDTPLPLIAQQAPYICMAYRLLLFFKPLFLDLNFRIHIAFVSKGGFSRDMKSWSSSTKKLIETELRFLYDEIYTKRPLLSTSIGVTLRSICFLCSCSALISFPFLVGIDDARKRRHSMLDIGISLILLLGAVVLEIYSILVHCLSDWSLLWASTHENLLSALICKLNSSKLISSDDDDDQEDFMLIPQYNLMNSSNKFKFKFKHLPFIIDNENLLKKYFCTSWEKMELKKTIHEHIKKQSAEHNKQKKDDYRSGFLASVVERVPMSSIDEEGYRAEVEESMRSAGFGECLIIWHLVTELCYMLDCNDHEVSSTGADTEAEAGAETGTGTRKLVGMKTSKLLSDYMMHILISESSMLINGGCHKFILETTCTQLADSETYFDIYDGHFLFEEILRRNEFNSRLEIAVQLFICLREVTNEDKWSLIKEVWMEVLTHVAQNCPGKEHIRCLGRGGDLLTYVCLLMAHYGLGSKIMLATGNAPSPNQRSYEWAIQFRQDWNFIGGVKEKAEN